MIIKMLCFVIIIDKAIFNRTSELLSHTQNSVGVCIIFMHNSVQIDQISHEQ